EMYAYFVTLIHIGIHREPRVSDHWRSHRRFGVKHLVGEYISSTRFEQIDRYFYCTKPRE
ncbi:hypothetical protein K469DRAFT_461543, partial [Zopfia rhizophila CBS 207.26]